MAFLPTTPTKSGPVETLRVLAVSDLAKLEGDLFRRLNSDRDAITSDPLYLEITATAHLVERTRDINEMRAAMKSLDEKRRARRLPRLHHNWRRP